MGVSHLLWFTTARFLSDEQFREPQMKSTPVIAVLAPLALAAALLAIPADEAWADQSGHSGGSYPLHDAAYRGDLTDVIHLLGNAHRLAVNKENRFDSVPLHLAAQYGHVPVVATLIAAGADVNAKNDAGSSPLHYAAQNGHAPVVATLIAAGANVNAKNDSDYGGWSPLLYAVQSDHAPVVAALIAAGADVNTKNNSGDTPLHYAAEKGNATIAATLIASGADVNAKNRYGGTPLRRVWDSTESRFHIIPRPTDLVASILIAVGGHWGTACVNTAIANPMGPSPPCICEPPNAETNHNSGCACPAGAFAHGDPSTAACYADHAPISHNLRHNVLFAVTTRNPTLVAHLIFGHGQNPDGKYYELHWAAQGGYESAAKALIEGGADIDRKNDAGDAPLHSAVRNERAELLVTLLLERGAGRRREGAMTATRPCIWRRSEPTRRKISG